LQSEVRQTQTFARTDQPQFAPRLSADQIRDLQALVQKALESSRAAMQKGQEAVFDWRQKDLGSLRFVISTVDKEVRVTIQSDRADVAEAIDKSRAVVERMITDQGLRVERFDVQLRTIGDPQARPENFAERQTQTRDNSNEQSGGGSADSGHSSADSQEDAPRRRPPGGDREWVA
jgi:hypothetical protein